MMALRIVDAQDLFVEDRQLRGSAPAPTHADDQDAMAQNMSLLNTTSNMSGHIGQDGEVASLEGIDLEANAVVAVTIASIAAWVMTHKAAIGATVVAYKGMMMLGDVTDRVLQAVWQPLRWSSSFKNRMGWYGLPLTVGLVNDSPWPVRILKHEVLRGTEFSFFPEGQRLQPGQESKWEAYSTHLAGEVRIAIQVEVEDSARTQYTVQAASFKRPLFWCSSPVANVFVGSWSDVWAEQKMLCKNPSGVKTNGRYYMAIFLADVTAHHM